MIKFDSKGYIFPYGPLQSNLEEVHSMFVFNDRRKELFEGYLRYIQDLKQIVDSPILQWVNGGFVTKAKDKAHPKDIDIVTFLAHSVYDQLDRANNKALQGFKYPVSVANYQVDGYIVKVYPPTHRFHALTQGDRLDWLHRFSRTKADRKGVKHEKGFIELSLTTYGREDQ